MESPLRYEDPMGHAEPGEAISAGPHEPPVRERPVAQEPTVVVAWDVAVFDERTPTTQLTSAMTVASATSPREPALTIPPEREITQAAARSARLQSRLLTVAAL